MNQRRESYTDFWLGFAFGSLSIAAFLAGAWSRGALQCLVP